MNEGIRKIPTAERNNAKANYAEDASAFIPCGDCTIEEAEPAMSGNMLCRKKGGKTMNEEIKKNEISEDELEAVSGGASVRRSDDGDRCELCGGEAFYELIDGKERVVCNVCGHWL